MDIKLRPDIVEAAVDRALVSALTHGDGLADRIARLVGAAPVFKTGPVAQQQRHTGAPGTIDIVVTYRPPGTRDPAAPDREQAVAQTFRWE